MVVFQDTSNAYLRPKFTYMHARLVCVCIIIILRILVILFKDLSHTFLKLLVVEVWLLLGI